MQDIDNDLAVLPLIEISASPFYVGFGIIGIALNGSIAVCYYLIPICRKDSSYFDAVALGLVTRSAMVGAMARGVKGGSKPSPV